MDKDHPSSQGTTGREPQRSVAPANIRSRRQRLVRRGTLFSLAIIAAALFLTWQWIDRDRAPSVLTVATGPAGSDAHTLMREAAEVTARHSDSLRLRVVSSRDASQNIALLNAKRIDAAVIRADTPVFTDIRGIANLYPDLFHIIVRDDVRAYSVHDLDQITISIPDYDTANFRSFWVVGDHYDLAIGGFEWTAEPFVDGAERLLDGDVDALFAVRSMRDRQLIRMFEDAQLTGLKLRYIPIRQADAIAVKRPFLAPSAVPMGGLTGALPVPTGPTPTLSVARVLVTRSDVDAEAIRELTRILFEHRMDLTIRFALASAITAPDTTRGLSVPLHEGAEAFFNRDEPSFVQENAEPLALLVMIMTGLISGMLALRSRFVANQKNRADVYNYQLLDIQERAADATTRAELTILKGELNAVLHTVVRALDTDEVTDEGFQSFSLLWEAVRETINDRAAEMKGDAG
ncbi:MAG: TAXI family TRAP transporter solute-binding subunit [Roseitalea sp.]|jgi:TRAP transporter TAXI family solute receptor|nr:TAXI family TRAP transporter solute-binding subunit [Roseitalea sp.]MBO6720924.1 TAXI family TRAP transporter solute-binding subunit [Roseitalea sp.]MBO6743229.1 TAXI family TRAP transporter solute-binding subunit [Roseitalea sp.]